MIYLLYGKEKFLIDEEIKKIIKENKINSISINNYDLDEILLDKIIDDANTFSLFQDKKVLIINNSYIFTGATRKKELEHDISKLESYIESPNEETIIIFTIYEEKIDERKKIVKKIKEKYVIKEFNLFNNTNGFVKEQFGDYKIDNKAQITLINRVGTDPMTLCNEIDKLKLYKIDNKEITEEDVINSTHKTIETDIFKFIDNIISKRKENALETYNELIKEGEEPIKIFIMIANKIRIMYQAKELYKKGYRENDVISNIGAHPYVIKKALEASRNYDNKTLLKYLSKLADLDRDIKIGNVDPSLALELFILNM